MQGESWLCPTELDRSRVVDANDRVRTIRRVGSRAVGAALVISAPWIGWWTLILFAASALNFAIVERRIAQERPPRARERDRDRDHDADDRRGRRAQRRPAQPGAALDGAARGDGRGALSPAGRDRGAGADGRVILVASLGVHPQWALEDPVPLIATLALLAGVISIVWALQAAELHHRDEAILDPLTGLLNRHALVPRFLEISHQARLTGQPVCMVLCDVDGFKQINDEHGHDCGDAVLRDIAYELRKRLRSFELVYRLGGEEFLTVLPGIGLQAGAEVAERLREAVEQARPTDIPITISLGVSAARGAQVDYDTLFKAADEALYEAKRTGRNRVVAAPEPARVECRGPVETRASRWPRSSWRSAPAGCCRSFRAQGR